MQYGGVCSPCQPLGGAWPIHETLAGRAPNSRGSPLAVRHASRVVPELGGGDVAVEVSLADRVPDAVDTALEDGEEALDGVGVHVAVARTHSPSM